MSSLDRLVESSRMKRAFEACYQSVLPKGSFPFVYLRYRISIALFFRYLLTKPSSSLQIDPRSVDVNVHPTKREVHFLNEESITEKIADGIQQNLAKQNHSRTFEYQASQLSNFLRTSTHLFLPSVHTDSGRIHKRGQCPEETHAEG